MADQIVTEPTKEIKYCRETHDYACYLGGELIGYAKTYGDGETLCATTYYDQCARHDNPAAEEQSVELAADVPFADLTPLDKHLSQDCTLGMIDGLVVMGHYNDGELMRASITVGDVEISTDGRECLNLPSTGDLEGDMSLTEWRQISPLARAGTIDRLIALAQQHQFVPGYCGPSEELRWREPDAPPPPTFPTETVNRLCNEIAAAVYGCAPPRAAALPKGFLISTSETLECGGQFGVPVTFRRADGLLMVNIGLNWEPKPVQKGDHCERPQIVREVSRFGRYGFVMVDTDEESFLMTEAEFIANGGEWPGVTNRRAAGAPVQPVKDAA